MTKREIVFAACRLMAVYIFMNSFWVLSSTLSSFEFLSITGTSFSTGPGPSSINVTFNGRPATPLEIILLVSFRLLPLVLHWVGAIGLWIFAREIAIRLFEGGPVEENGEQQFQIGSEARAIAFSCLGLLFLAQDIPYICLWLINSAWSFVVWTYPNPLSQYYRPSWELLIRIPLSLWLIFGWRGLAGLWRMAQEKGFAPVGKRPNSD